MCTGLDAVVRLMDCGFFVDFFLGFLPFVVVECFLYDTVVKVAELSVSPVFSFTVVSLSDLFR